MGASPHMMSATVMALARMLYEFVPQLQTSAPQLLPVILSLLRSKSREVIKSVLGFIKVSFDQPDINSPNPSSMLKIWLHPGISLVITNLKAQIVQKEVKSCTVLYSLRAADLFHDTLSISYRP